MKILVTGGSGFLGRHLVVCLRRRFPDAHLFVTSRSGKSVPGTEAITLDPLDAQAVLSWHQTHPVESVYHLSGLSRVSEDLPFSQYFEHNFLSTVYLVDALKATGFAGPLFLASSVQVYGNQRGIIREGSRLSPESKYAFSKYLSEKCVQAASDSGFRAVIGRIDSCLGPGQSLGFVAPDLIRKILKADSGGESKISIANASVTRHFLDARDAARMIVDLMEQAKVGCDTINIASPRAISITDILHNLLEIYGKPLQMVPSREQLANPFAGLALSIDKLEDKLPGCYFTDLKTTLRDLFVEMRQGAEEDGGKA